MAEASVRSLLSNRRYVLYLVSRISLIVSAQMLSVAVGWQVYEITGKALALGLSGLALFLPGFLLALPGGHVADRHDRQRILVVCHLGMATAAASLAFMAHTGTKRLAPIYAVLAILGTIRAFSGPAGQALMPNLVERKELERAVALGSSSWQLAMIAGPSLGGALYAATGTAGAVYVACTCMSLVACASVVAIGKTRPEGAMQARPPADWSTLLAGLRYVWTNKAILGAISLDLFAVLLGGAVALLPIFAKALAVGPWGLGMLRSAPAVGAATVALLIAYSPLKRRAGAIMFACVFLFGIATIVFGVSKEFGVSLAALIILGASDMFSVVVRSTLIQIRTPDEMRGRVGAVNLVFIGASNELGEFESGVTAAWLGPELAVVLGGIGTCIVVVIWALLFPELRNVDRLDS
ncbi:MFS general substrate transporter [Labilithrix luteola]|uniref:MFS general substrate transporter n=1 Tax=Labilithrix luteola TaxID=1391654 RepID=A0A0K1QEK8_9BACT|nr:MFS transporter [Labilithrix luteola]AKV04102.1 MFS general substrate transporter [Labilithrix luteola]